MPEGVDIDKVSSSLSPDGILTVEAPRKKPQPALGPNERAVPIQVQNVPTTPTKVTTNIPVQKETPTKPEDKKN
ncbi:Heat shock protein beta-1 like protein [Argiope bruennichi]|uniref:Heat shock protein beta-1 like protein n=2 Tax=Argiope bruennichi TaxID=94029 RepID=A0A8T0E5Z8_ARGBR|nr:Heat shock protein beta-1 like protein [Argiope bruennichi]